MGRTAIPTSVLPAGATSVGIAVLPNGVWVLHTFPPAKCQWWQRVMSAQMQGNDSKWGHVSPPNCRIS